MHIVQTIAVGCVRNFCHQILRAVIDKENIILCPVCFVCQLSFDFSISINIIRFTLRLIIVAHTISMVRDSAIGYGSIVVWRIIMTHLILYPLSDGSVGC